MALYKPGAPKLQANHALAANLSSFFAFNEGTGNKVNDVLGRIGTTVLANSWATDRYGPVAVFGTQDNAIDLSSAIVLSGAAPWTIACGVYMSAVTYRGPFTGAYVDGATNLHLDGGTGTFTAPAITAGVWLDIVVVCDGTSGGNVTLYVNSGTGINVGVGSAYSYTVSRIGSYDSGLGNSWSGRYDYFATWTGRKLSSAEVTSLAADPFGVVRPVIGNNQLTFGLDI